MKLCRKRVKLQRKRMSQWMKSKNRLMIQMIFESIVINPDANCQSVVLLFVMSRAQCTDYICTCFIIKFALFFPVSYSFMFLMLPAELFFQLVVLFYLVASCCTFFFHLGTVLCCCCFLVYFFCQLAIVLL